MNTFSIGFIDKRKRSHRFRWDRFLWLFPRAEKELFVQDFGLFLVFQADHKDLFA